MREYSNDMKISEIKNDMRVSFMEELEAKLKELYEVVGKVSSNEIAVVMGTYVDEDGCPIDTTVTVKVSAKPFYDKAPALKSNGKMGREINFYDAKEHIENFAKGVEA